MVLQLQWVYDVVLKKSKGKMSSRYKDCDRNRNLQVWNEQLWRSKGKKIRGFAYEKNMLGGWRTAYSDPNAHILNYFPQHSLWLPNMPLPLMSNESKCRNTLFDEIKSSFGSDTQSSGSVLAARRSLGFCFINYWLHHLHQTLILSLARSLSSALNYPPPPPVCLSKSGGEVHNVLVTGCLVHCDIQFINTKSSDRPL